MIGGRLTLVVTLAVGLLVAPLVADAQPAGKIPRIGALLDWPSRPAMALREELREFGYVEGQNIAIEWWGTVGAEGYPDVGTLLGRKVDVIIALNDPAVLVAQKATSTIPIVMVLATDPVGLGFVASLGRPGGNITGLSLQAPEVAGKAMQFLKETVPNLSRVAVLWDPTFPGMRAVVRATEAGARRVGVQLQLLEARGPSELEGAFATIASEGAGAVYVQVNATIFVHRRIAELAVKSRLPSMCLSRAFVEAGCLMSFGASPSDLYRRTAYFVDKILKGGKPADLPVEQPTKFELVINLKTAKALGITISRSLLLRADEVIE